MEEGPRNIIGHLLSLQWWCPWSSIIEVTFDLVPFWVQVHGIPLEAPSTKSTEKIGSRLGVVFEVEDPFSEGQLLRSFLRILGMALLHMGIYLLVKEDFYRKGFRIYRLIITTYGYALVTLTKFRIKRRKKI